MPRQVRIQYPGAMYHVMSRGNLRQAIYRENADRQDFLKTLAAADLKTGWQIHAYCLMENHSPPAFVWAHQAAPPSACWRR